MPTCLPLRTARGDSRWGHPRCPPCSVPGCTVQWLEPQGSPAVHWGICHHWRTTGWTACPYTCPAPEHPTSQRTHTWQGWYQLDTSLRLKQKKAKYYEKWYNFVNLIHFLNYMWWASHFSWSWGWNTHSHLQQEYSKVYHSVCHSLLRWNNLEYYISAMVEGIEKLWYNQYWTVRQTWILPIIRPLYVVVHWTWLCPQGSLILCWWG